MKKAISIPGAPAPIGPYSQAIVKNNSLFVSGQIPLNPKTGELVLDSTIWPCLFCIRHCKLDKSHTTTMTPRFVNLVFDNNIIILYIII